MVLIHEWRRPGMAPVDLYENEPVTASNGPLLAPD